MKLMEKHPLVMIIIGIAGISLSAIFVKYSQAPSVVTALYRLMWTVALMTPVVLGRKDCRRALRETDRKTVLLCGASGVFLALHFTAWFESLNQTSVASSTAIVCTEVIWCLGAMASDALSTGAVWDALILEAVNLAVFLLAHMRKCMRWIRISGIIMILVALYMTKDFWLSLSWWVYLLAAGLGLIVFAAVNEMKKR